MEASAALVISPEIRAKLKIKHSVEESEVIEAFANRERGFLIDIREEHLTDPPTEWFVAETDRGRKLKICFVRTNGNIYLKTAYTAESHIVDIYERHA